MGPNTIKELKYLSKTSMNTLNIVGAILTEWLLIVAEVNSDWKYYGWAFLMMVLWSEAVNSRNPRLYPKRAQRILYFSVFFIMFFMVNKSVIFLRNFELPVS